MSDDEKKQCREWGLRDAREVDPVLTTWDYDEVGAVDTLTWKPLPYDLAIAPGIDLVQRLTPADQWTVVRRFVIANEVKNVISFCQLNVWHGLKTADDDAGTIVIGVMTSEDYSAAMKSRCGIYIA